MADRNWGCRVSLEHTYKGWRVAVLENELLRVSVLIDKGSDIFEFLHKPSDTDFMWHTPWGLHRQGRFTASSALASGSFGDLYEGGWQDIFPSGGAANVHAKTDFGLHGEASLLPWEARVLKDTAGEVSVEFSVDTVRTAFRAVKTLTLKKGSGALFIGESLTNTGEEPAAAMWGHHPAFGAPFLSPDCRVDLPGAVAELHHEFSGKPRFDKGTQGRWPLLKGSDKRMIDISRFPDPKRRSADMFYLKNLKGNWYALTNTKSKVGFGLAWDLKAFPYIWYWQVYKGGMGTPFWGRTYNCALEPFSSIPTGLANAVKAGTHLSFKPGQTRRAWLTAVAYAGKTKVSKVTRAGRVS